MGTRVNDISGQDEVVIKWKGLPDYDYSWEWKTVIHRQFPHFDLEDKVNFKEPGNATYESERPPILYQYRRRSKTQKA